MHSIGFVTGLTQDLDVGSPEIFVELYGEAHRSGINSSSRARAAA
jgi:hypothetical protein